MSEEQAQQLLYQMQMLENYLGDLSNREHTLVNILHEGTAAIESIKSITQEKNDETLVPLGIGTFAKAKINSTEKIVVNLGAGIAIEKDRDSALNYLESRIKEMGVALKETSAKKQEIMTSLEQGKKEMNRLVSASPTNKQ